MEDQGNSLGRGWKFPPTFDEQKGTVDMVEGEYDVKESLIILMRTRIGERTMEASYGCDLTSIAFEQLDLNLETAMVNNIKQTIAEHEPRVDVQAITLTPNYEEGSILIHLTYTIKGLPQTQTLQYSYHPIYHK